MFLPIGVLELARFASKDSTRETLHFIQIRQNATHIVAAATDGFVLAMYSSPLLGEREQEHRDFYLPAKRVLEILKFVPAKAKKEGADLDIEAGTLTFGFGRATYKITVASVVEFPNVDRIREASYDAPAKAVDLDAQFLAKISTYLKAVNHSTIVTMEPHGELEPIKLSLKYDGTDVQFFCMPCRR